MTSYRRLAAVVLALLSVGIAEVSIGDIPFTPVGLLALAFFLPIYGGGVVMVREAVVRRGAGWRGVLLLGFAYCLVEEGLALQSLFSPTVYDGIGPAMGAHVLGVNGVYLLLQLVNHAVWSIAVPILLTDLVFPAHRGRPYVGRVGLVVAGVAYVVGVGLTALTARFQLDPGYRAPAAVLVGTAVAVVVLAALALARPRLDAAPPTAPAAEPSPARVFAAGFAFAVVFLAVLWEPGHFRWAFVRGPGVLVPILVAVAALAVAAELLRRRGPGMAQPQLVALAGGLVLGHALVGGVNQAGSPGDRAGVGIVFLLTCVLLAGLARRVRDRRPVAAG
jgi:hypothetical protein